MGEACPYVEETDNSMRLNLGCAERHMTGYVNVDIAPPADELVDLSGPWPWEDSSVEEVLAYDVIEHIGDWTSQAVIERHWFARGMVDEFPERHTLGRVHFMNELHRVLKPGAQATIETPNAARGCGYPCDPTHVSPWCLSTFRYFEKGSFAHTRLSAAYGITAAFKIVSLEEARFPAEFSPQQIPYTEPPFAVWVPARAEVAWKIRAVLEAVK